MPGNRDEFPFSTELFSPLLYVSREVQFSARKPIVTTLNNMLIYLLLIDVVRRARWLTLGD